MTTHIVPSVKWWCDTWYYDIDSWGKVCYILKFYELSTVMLASLFVYATLYI